MGRDMAEIVESIEISRHPEEVFSYVTDFSRFPDWQGGVVSARREGDAPLAVGSRAVVTRRAGPRELARTEEITELRPPRTWAVRGVGGPIIATARDDRPRVRGTRHRKAARCAHPAPSTEAAAEE